MKEIKHITKDSHQTTREESKRKRKEQEELLKHPEKNSDKLGINTYLLTATLNGNGLNAPIKCYRVANWIKNKTRVYAAYKRHTSDLQTLTN